MAKQNKGRKFFAASATAALVASAIVPVASAAQVNDYNKISGYAKDAVQALVDQGVIQGDTNGNFNPLNTVTRAQAAEIFTKALELEADGDVNFSDVKKGAWYYNSIAAVVANGIFEGVSANEFAPNKSLTRSEAAKVLVDAFGLEGSESLSQFADASQVKGWAKESLEIAVANGIFTGSEENGKLNLKPNAAITRQDFAVVFARTLDLVDTETPVEATSVKAINNTTVEVSFDEKVGNLDDLKFAIDGLEIKNKAHKQSNDKVVVLTTASQEAGKEYTVTLDGEKIGSFKGVEAVIPTSIDIVEKSQQNVLGNNVTLKAQVTVAEGQSKAGIPVTFNIVNAQGNQQNPGGALNQPIIGEAVTDENGVASYTYTRYASTAQQLVTNDEVQAYATGKPALRSFAKVYWAAIQPLTITEVTTGNSINNGGKKVYKVKLAGHLDLRTAAEVTANNNGFVNIAFQENINVTPDKAVKDVTITDGSGNALGYPAQFTTTSSTSTTNFNAVRVQLDANGEATFTLTGSNATVTPIVFKDAYANSVNTDPSFGRLDTTELQAKAPSVTFAKSQVLKLALESVGTKNASAYAESFATPARGVDALEVAATSIPAGHLRSRTYTAADLSTVLANTGGRDYKAVYTDKDGKLAQSGQQVRVSLAYGSAKQAAQASATPIYVVDKNTRTVYRVSDFTKSSEEFTLTTNAKGEVSFTVIGGRDSYATPTVFLETGDKAGLDKNDEQQVGEIVYFGDRVINKAKLTVNDENTATATVADNAVFTYESVDQNDKYYFIPGTQNFVATFQVSTTFASAAVANTTNGLNTALGTVNQGSTQSYDVTAVNGRAQITVSSTRGNRVDVVASASQATLPILSASATFSTLNNEGVAEGQEVKGRVIAIDTNTNRILLTDSKGEVVYELKYAADELALKGTGVTEATFESNLTVGDELHFVQKNGTAKAKFDNLDIASGVNVNTALASRKVFTLAGDSAGTAIDYNFGGQTVNANFLITGDNVKLSNGTVAGNITVGQANSQQTVNDFAIDGLTVTGTVTVNQGDGNTFQVLGNSNIQNLVLNIGEHVELANTATINTLNANVTGFAVTGVGNAAPGVLNTLILANGVSSKAISNTTAVTPGNTITGTVSNALVAVTTATGDTVKLTFSENVTTSDVAVVDVTTAPTTADVATVAVANDQKSLEFTTTTPKSKKFEVTYKGTTYTVKFDTTAGTWTFVKKPLV